MSVDSEAAYRKARDMAGCSEGCKVALRYDGVEGKDMHVYHVTHDQDAVDVRVGIGTPVVEQYNALGRALKELGKHGN